MKENKKNIERLFQEKFKDFEAIPPLDSWKKVEERLNEKNKKRRVIPFWFKTSGIAAILTLGIFLFMNKKNNLNNIVNDVVIENNAVSNTENPSVNSSKTNEAVNEELILIKENNNKSKVSDKIINTDDKQKIVIQDSPNKQNNVSAEENSLNKTKRSGLSNSKNQIIVSGLKKKWSKENKTNLSSSKIEINENIVATNKNLKEEKLDSKITVVANEIISSDHLKENFTVQSNKNSSEKNSNNQADEVVLANPSNKKNIESKILIQNNVIATAIQDSTLVAEVETEENPLEKLLKEKLERENADEKEKEKRNKWAASTYASPVYFNSTSQGSPIDDQFSESSKTFESSLSYGLGLEYELSEKFSIKTGINTLAFNYTTNNVFYTTTLRSVSENIKTITRNNNGENLALANRNMMIDEADVENFIQNNEGSLNQEMGYIEVPLELSYKLFDTKIGINIIGGMSTLFLNSNSVTLISNGAETNIGKANNLNNIHFSSNVGLGFKYTFWKSFQANFQPMFKYQINTFSSNSGNFKPYFVGLYSGVSFSF
uniref:hypothetical protein n=1 Tax=Flavobacterium sp. TaxID=239 RepID=UPI0040490011